MNREFCLRLADAIESLGRGERIGPLKRFDMSVWRCKTVGCIAGTACALLVHEGKRKRMPGLAIMSQEAAAAMGLYEQQAERLFCGRFSHKARADITPAEAAAQVRRMVEANRAS